MSYPLDAILGPDNVAGMARIYATLGEAELATEQIRYLLDIPTVSMNRQWLLKGAGLGRHKGAPSSQNPGPAREAHPGGIGLGLNLLLDLGPSGRDQNPRSPNQLRYQSCRVPMKLWTKLPYGYSSVGASGSKLPFSIFPSQPPLPWPSISPLK